MKILTLNTHSLIEENYQQKLLDFVNAISKIQPDIIALQEVNQSALSAEINKESLTGYIPCQTEIPVKYDNHAYNAVKMLYDNGIKYHWTYLPIKLGYDKFDEGLALLSRNPIDKTDVILISRINDYNNWKTRKVIGILTGEKWFYSVHIGWWNDDEEPFCKQWNKLTEHLQNKKNIFLMGDFNNSADIRNEGYDMIIHSGWHDTYNMAVNKDGGMTVHGKIDGWNDNSEMRIDFIFTDREYNIKSSKVIFNGKNEPVISDHSGIIIDTGE